MLGTIVKAIKGKHRRNVLAHKIELRLAREYGRMRFAVDAADDRTAARIAAYRAAILRQRLYRVSGI